ncbi:hypothetical protein SAMN05661096_00046 [Marivirga sericea]|uniref:Uncharacterized protein n=1 Tax=Marivirga sericea TaxID=1028 RepID=A0A1X7I0Y4_9BACT|nr:hypothetical protein [Marivirga sericea]SMG07534.1 hypothetical protein SAMN05661096_00046 [Marivirga sericea]
MKDYYLPQLIIIFLFSLSSCKQAVETNVPRYYELVKDAEMQIVDEKYKDAVNLYQEAFRLIEKPFGKDVFNAALASQYAGLIESRNQFLQVIINNSENAEKTKSVFVSSYLDEKEWNSLIDQKVIDYDPVKRAEFEGIFIKDQLHRPHYDEFDSIIEVNERSNLQQIIGYSKTYGFPSQVKLGYPADLVSQGHHIVLLHVARRRAEDKSVMNLKNMMRSAVEAGRLDPEAALTYLYYQKDMSDSAYFLPLSQYWVYTHDSLPDNLKTKIMRDPGSPEELEAHNAFREKWYATNLTARKEKLLFLKNTKLPFIFSSINHNMNTIDFSGLIKEEELLEKYASITRGMEPIYSNNSMEMTIKKR